jgi:hypothetical protein
MTSYSDIARWSRRPDHSNVGSCKGFRMPQRLVRPMFSSWITAFGLYLTSTLHERLGPPSGFPVATSDLLCSNDAGTSRSLAVPTSKIAYASYRRDSTRKVGEDTADSPGRAHLFLLCTKIIVRSSPGCIDPDQDGGNPGQCDPRIAVAVRDKVRATLVFA